MFSLGRKPDPKCNLHALFDRAFAELDPLRFHNSIDGAIACRPMVQALNRLGRSSDRFAPVKLEALVFVLAQLPQSTITETFAKEYATDPVVVAVVAGALRYVRHKDTNSENDKKIRRLVARLKPEWSRIA